VSGIIKYYLPPVAWMGVIFLFSTSGFSGAVTGSVLQTLLDLLGVSYTSDYLKGLNFVVRKAAHLFIYAVLALLWLRAFVTGSGLGSAPALFLSLFISVACAVADEYHQSLIPERTAKPADAMLDSGASALALVLAGPALKRRGKNNGAAIKRRHKTFFRNRKLNF